MTTAEILNHFQGVKKVGPKKWKAKCPAHNDKQPSLSIKQEDGKTLVKCFAECSFDQIATAAGLTRSDFFLNDVQKPQDNAQGPSKLKPTNNPDFKTLEEAGKAFKKRYKTVTKYIYRDADGKEIMAVFRLDMDDGKKTFRPLTRIAGGWRFGDPEGPLPLYNLPEVLQAKAVYVCEGEKAADALASIGLTATTSAHGSKSASKTDWTPLKGRAVVILPDNDAPGQQYANDVASLVTDAGAKTVKIVELPELPKSGDIADFLEARDAIDPEQIRETIEKLADNAPDWKKPEPEATNESATGPEDLRAKLWTVAQQKLGATEFHRKCAEKVVEWLHARGRFYFHQQRKEFSGVMFFDKQRKLLLPVQGDSFLAWLADCIGINRAEKTFKFAASAAESEGLSERSKGIVPEHFFASREKAFYLSSGAGQIVKIDKDGCSKVDNGVDGVLFAEFATLPKWDLCEPVNPFEKCMLFKNMAAATEHGKLLTELWTIAIPTNLPNKPPLCFTSPAGGGKTATIRGIFRLYGMPESVDKVKKDGERDFWKSVNMGGLYCLDNADTKIDWLPDSLAAAATGGTQQKHKLYTDFETVILHAKAWIAITSLNPTFASDAGLADRLLVNRLERRNGETAENALYSEIEGMRDSGLSFIAKTLSEVLADTESTPGGLNARHPDFATLAIKIGRAIGKEQEAIRAMKAAELDKHLFNIENHWIGSVLLETIQKSSYRGGAGKLLDLLKETDPGLDGKLSAKRLGKQLDRLWPHLEATLAADRWQDSHSKKWVYEFKFAGFAGFE